MSTPEYYYHFVGDTLRDGQPVPPDGDWLTHDGEIVICKSGLHASVHPFDALQYAPGAILCRVKLEDIIDRQEDKVVSRRRQIVARVDAGDLLRAFARFCAREVLHLWPAPPVVQQYLETGDASLRAAAWAAAGDAAWAAARAGSNDAAAGNAAIAAVRATTGDAAWAAAGAAAWAAARAAAGAAAGAGSNDAADAIAAAWAAAGDAAWAAAIAAVRDARDAARDAQRARFAQMVDDAFADVPHFPVDNVKPKR